MKKKICIIAVLAILLLAVNAVTAVDADAHLSGSQTTAFRGSEVTVTLSLDEPTVLYSGFFDLKYDETVLDLVEARIVLGGTPEINRFDPDDKFPEEGVDGTGAFVMRTPTEQSGVLFSAKFTVKSDAAFAKTEVEMKPILKKSTTEVLTVDYTKASITVVCNHDFSLSTVDSKYFAKDATCTVPMLYYKSCSICGAAGTDTFTVGAANGHSGGTATCIQKAVCTVCSEPYGDFAAHAYTAETVKSEALKTAGTCKDEAVYRYSCSVCSKVETDNDTHTFKGDKDPQNHAGGTQTINYSAAVHKTQTAGYTGDTQCLGCNGIIATGEVITPTPHVASQTWSADADSHWKLCSVEGCSVEMADSRVSHRFDNVCDADCNDCGQKRTPPHDYSEDFTSDADHHWHKCKLCDATTGVADHNFVNGTCDICSYLKYMLGDVNGDLVVNEGDAIHLLKNTLRPDRYPVNQPCDFNKDGNETEEDAIYLLKYTLRPNRYPIG